MPDKKWPWNGFGRRDKDGAQKGREEKRKEQKERDDERKEAKQQKKNS